MIPCVPLPFQQYVNMVQAIAVILTALCILLSLVWLFWRQRLKKYAHFKFNPTFPLLGHSLYLPYDPHQFLLYIIAQLEHLGDTFVLWFGCSPLILTADPKWAEAVLSSQELITKSDFYDFLHEWLGFGLLTSTGKKWKNRRKILTPTFHFTILNDFAEVFQEQSELLVKRLNDLAGSGKELDIQTPIGLVALDIISETAMGVKINAQQSSTSEYVQAVLRMTAHVQRRQRNPLLWPNFLYGITHYGIEYKKDLKTLLDFTNNVIEKRISDRNFDQEEPVKATKKIAFLDLLLDLYVKGEIDLQGIREEVDTFMFEGHDTTAAAMSWSIYMIGLYPEVQKKIHEEIDSMPDDDLPVIDKVRNLKYLEAAIKEALRLYPSVPLYGRYVSKSTVIDNKLVPKGTSLLLLSYGLHRNKAYWTNPDDFNPDRFLADDFATRHPYQYVPFSAGPRNCVGQKFALLEEKIVLYNVMKYFSVKTVQAIKDVKLHGEIILRSNNGLWVELQRR